MTDTVEDLEALMPDTVPVVVDDIRVDITAMTFGQVVKVTKLLRGPLAELESSDDKDQDLLLGLLTKYPDELADVITIAAKIERDVLDDLMPDHIMRLVMAIYQANMGFFAESLGPVLTEMVGRINKAPDTAGATS